MITYKQITAFNIDEIKSLYESVDWFAYTNDLVTFKKALNNSLYVLGAYENENLIGLIRVVGDGMTIVYIQDILSHPDFQRQGIGTHLINTVVEQYKHVRQKLLLTETVGNTIKFYESLGFKQTNDLGLTSLYKEY